MGREREGGGGRGREGEGEGEEKERGGEKYSHVQWPLVKVKPPNQHRKCYIV